jgi:hypothetical protein
MTQGPPIPPSSQPPGTLNYGQPPPRRGDIREIAVRQKAIMFCILAYIGALVLSLALPQELKWVAGIAMLGASITATVFVFMLAMAIYSQGVGILLGILTLIPCIGLIVLLVVNAKATNILKEHGFKVGLMGVPKDQIPSP